MPVTEYWSDRFVICFSTRLAALKIQAGDHIKYVYDLGDWIEHTLELRAIHDPDKGARYLHEVARNELKYVYWVECQQKGTVVPWVCYTC